MDHQKKKKNFYYNDISNVLHWGLSPEVGSSWVERVVASSSMLTSSELVWRRELVAPILSLMELKSTSGMRSSAPLYENFWSQQHSLCLKISILFGSFELHNSILLAFLIRVLSSSFFFWRWSRQESFSTMLAVSSLTRFCISLASSVALATTSA